MLRCASRLLRNQTTRVKKNFASTATFDNHSDNFLSGDNALYVEEMFDQWKSDRTAVHSSWDAYFTNLSNGLESKDAFKPAPMGQAGFTPMAAYTQGPRSTENSGFTDHYQNVFQEKLASMILRYRRRAHEIATIDPLNIEENVQKFRVKFKPVEETPETYGFSAADLDKPIEYYSRLRGFHEAKKQWTPQEASQLLQEIYSGNISYEYMHIHHVEIHDWIRDRIENRPPFKLSKDQKYNLLDRILESQAFTDFCDKKYSSSKRFGIDGLDSAISGLEALVDSAKDLGVSHVIVGMAHRGRLNTLACVFDKPYEAIFTEFKDPGISKNIKSAEWGFSGDVKYHLGASNQRTYPDGSRISMTMLPNPSHLETVNPVALGKARSKMDQVRDKTGDRVLSVLVHGDAAFSGQGIVYETLQMEILKGYSTHGTIHVVFNNHVGFTTNPSEGRSNLMKTNNSFIIHVNADYPEEVDFAFKLAIEYRMKFKRDVVVDISGYRKYGHNEQDMPKFTQPKMYQRVEKKEPMWKMYSKRLVDEGTFTQEEIDQLYQKKIDRLEDAFEKAKTENFNPKEWDSTAWGTMLSSHSNSGSKAFNTNISEHDFKLIGKKITTLPTGKDFHSIIVKNYEQRLKSIESGQNIDWATAEALAFGSLLTEGFGVRLSGEDVRRGTFSHRHAALVDQKDGSRYYPLRQLVDRDEEIRMQVYNSLLSEYGVLGFDYGYSIGAPNYLTLWEAQFGDFVNVAQPIIDQYISSAERKWGVRSGLVMLLPHGFDGQGPEHSSARVERFLQLIDDDPYDTRFIEGSSAKQAKMANMSVVNITEPANYFHCLRRQVVNSDFRKPLIVLSPKKLLRLKAAQSKIEDFTHTKHFTKVLPEPKPQEIDAPEKVKQVIFCSGQLFYDLISRREELKQKDTAIVRLEQIAPFPYNRVEEQLKLYPNAEITWAQEEHRNQGAWTYVKERLELVRERLGCHDPQVRYVGRKIAASTAVGSANTHKKQLEDLLTDAFKTN